MREGDADRSQAHPLLVAEHAVGHLGAGELAVVRVDDVVLGNGVSGPVTRRFRDALDRICAGENPDFDRWLHYV